MNAVRKTVPHSSASTAVSSLEGFLYNLTIAHHLLYRRQILSEPLQNDSDLSFKPIQTRLTYSSLGVLNKIGSKLLFPLSIMITITV